MTGRSNILLTFDAHDGMTRTSCRAYLRVYEAKIDKLSGQELIIRGYPLSSFDSSIRAKTVRGGQILVASSTQLFLRLRVNWVAREDLCRSAGPSLTRDRYLTPSTSLL